MTSIEVIMPLLHIIAVIACINKSTRQFIYVYVYRYRVYNIYIYIYIYIATNTNYNV